MTHDTLTPERLAEQVAAMKVLHRFFCQQHCDRFRDGGHVSGCIVGLEAIDALRKHTSERDRCRAAELLAKGGTGS